MLLIIFIIKKQFHYLSFFHFRFFNCKQLVSSRRLSSLLHFNIEQKLDPLLDSYIVGKLFLCNIITFLRNGKLKEKRALPYLLDFDKS